MSLLETDADRAPVDRALIETACGLLRQFICTEPAPETTNADLVRQAVRIVADHSDYQILGICADSLTDAAAALQHYAAALGYEIPAAIQPAAIQPAVVGPIYVKFNPKTMRCHTDSYIGVHRGVLLSCQSAYDRDVNETFGHLPLDLFDA